MLIRHASVQWQVIIPPFLAHYIFSIPHCFVRRTYPCSLQEEFSGRPAATEEVVYARNKTVFERLARATERKSVSKQGRKEIFVPRNRTNLYSSKRRFLWNKLYLKFNFFSLIRIMFHVFAYQQPNWIDAKNCYLHINRHYFCLWFVNDFVCFTFYKDQLLLDKNKLISEH